MAASIPEIGYGEFLEEARAYERRTPLEGTLETTYRCNLSCVHCYVNLPAADAGARLRELPLERLTALIDEIVEAGGFDLLLTGGEVLARSDFPELYLHAVRRGLRVTVFTNGTLVTDRIAALFAEHSPACVEITLYGMTRETYERVTRVPGSFDRCLAGVRRLLAHRVPLRLKSMVLTWNQHELEAMRAFARELGVPFRYDSLLNPRVDCGASRNGELQISAELAVAMDLSDPDRLRSYEAICRQMHEIGPEEPADHVYTCGAGEMGFTVDPYGQLQLCQLSRRHGFDLRQGSFARGWNEFFPALRQRRWQSNAVCRSCSLRPLCGSCPGAAELEMGDAEGMVPQFCEITHLRAETLMGAGSGHRRDATCCLGQGRLTSSREPAGTGCDGCGHRAEPAPLIQVRRRP